MNIEQEILRVTEQPARGADEDQQVYLTRIVIAVNGLTDDNWITLTMHAQKWSNAAIALYDAKAKLPPMDTPDTDSVPTPDTDSVPTPDTDSVPTPDTDSVPTPEKPFSEERIAMLLNAVEKALAVTLREVWVFRDSDGPPDKLKFSVSIVPAGNRKLVFSVEVIES